MQAVLNRVLSILLVARDAYCTRKNPLLELRDALRRNTQSANSLGC